jgi:hypothetical protein
MTTTLAHAEDGTTPSEVDGRPHSGSAYARQCPSSLGQGAPANTPWPVGAADRATEGKEGVATGLCGVTCIAALATVAAPSPPERLARTSPPESSKVATKLGVHDQDFRNARGAEIVLAAMRARRT